MLELYFLTLHFAFVVGAPGRVAVNPLAVGELGMASKPASPVGGPTQVYCGLSLNGLGCQRAVPPCSDAAFQKLLVIGAACGILWLL